MASTRHARDAQPRGGEAAGARQLGRPRLHPVLVMLAGGALFALALLW
jgi:hypothetical protein